MNNYNDIIDYQYKGSLKRKRMALEKRAAIFAPFSALTGYEESIKETGRQTKEKQELSEEAKNILNEKLNIIKLHQKENPKIKVTYFKKDLKKEGGEYITQEGYIKKIDEIKKQIIFINKEIILIDDISKIESNLFFNLEN